MKINNYPEEYTRGWVEFFYQKFVVNEHVLIPRLETESLVREAVKYCRENPPDVFIDIGTGSGIIPLSILSAVHIPQVFAVDLSPEALEVAKQNCLDQGKNITFLESDLLEVFLEDKQSLFSTSLLGAKRRDSNGSFCEMLFRRVRNLLKNDEVCAKTAYRSESYDCTVNEETQGLNAKFAFCRDSYILLVTNLPYIKQDDWENMSTDTVHEPRLALFGWEHTGFELYEKLFAQIGDFTAKYQPAKLTVLAEMGDDQVDVATEVLAKYGWKFSFFADLRWIARFMKVEIL